MKFISEDLPPRERRSNTDYPRMLAELAARPGEWAALDAGKMPTMYSYASRYRGMAHGRFEFRAVRDADDAARGTLYGRAILNE